MATMTPASEMDTSGGLEDRIESDAEIYYPSTSPTPVAHVQPFLDNYEDLLEKDFAYDMANSRRGVAIIINNEKFDSDLRLPDRTGSRKDEEALKQTFTYLGFEEVIIERDLTAEHMCGFLSTVASRTDLKSMDAVMVAILSHGDSDGIFGTDRVMPSSKLFAPFRESSGLAGKPKIFVIQACRGKDTDVGHKVSFDAPVPTSYNMKKQYYIAKESDILTSYSTVEGYLAWRSNSQGSWFIQTFCKVMRRHGKSHEIHQLLTRVNQIVSYTYSTNSNGNGHSLSKQSPCFTSTLTKSLTFT